MDAMCQRGKIQEESLYYEHKKRDGSLPLIGVNTFLPKDHAGEVATTVQLVRSSEPEKAAQIASVRTFQVARNSLSVGGASGPIGSGQGLGYLQTNARDRNYIFAALMESVRTHWLG